MSARVAPRVVRPFGRESQDPRHPTYRERSSYRTIERDALTVPLDRERPMVAAPHEHRYESKTQEREERHDWRCRNFLFRGAGSWAVVRPRSGTWRTLERARDPVQPPELVQAHPRDTSS